MQPTPPVVATVEAHPLCPIATKSEQQQRSRSRSVISNQAGSQPPITTPTSAAQYSPESHPTTDPSLLALTQQQVSDTTPVPVDSALLEQSQLVASVNAFPIDPALGGGSPPAEASAAARVGEVASMSPPTIDMSHFQEAPAALEEEMPEVEPKVEDDPATRTSGRTSKRASAAAEDNDVELRRLANENQNVELGELARRVRNDENSPSAEKTRQVYGLGW